jgi:uncharacterized membrane protein YhiD involved in acid resistance
MENLDLIGAIGVQNAAAAHVLEILLRLSAAALLGSLLAYRPWRRLLAGTKPVETQTAQSQMLIAVAGVVMVVVIGESTARAFGLVGLGAFVRFRSGLKDPRDAAAMFVMIGIGMSCGLGLLPNAVLVTGFVGVVMLVLDATKGPDRSRTRLALSVDQPQSVAARLRDKMPGLRIVEFPGADPNEHRLVVEVEAEDDFDAMAFRDMVSTLGIQGVHGVAVLPG